METKRHYHGHLDRIADRLSSLPDAKEAEVLVLLAIIIQMGHYIREKLTDYWQRVTISTHVSTVAI